MLCSTRHRIGHIFSAQTCCRRSRALARPFASAGYGNVTDQNLPSAYTDSQVFSSDGAPKTPAFSSHLTQPTFGQPYCGTDRGPDLLLSRGLPGNISNLGWRVDSSPALPAPSFSSPPRGGKADLNAKNGREVGSCALALAKAARGKAMKGRFPLSLGGDHSIALGSLAGLLRARPNLGVIWVDAHADLNTPWISQSGNMHGMPLGLLTEGMVPPGRSLGEVEGLEWLEEGWEGDKEWPKYTLTDPPPRLSPSSIVYVGLRDVDQEEREAIKSLNIKYYTMYDIDRIGIGQVMERAIAHLLEQDGDRPLHLSYDIDAVDPRLAPATGTAVRGGLTYREAHFVAERVCASGNLASADLVELNPTLSDEEGAEDTVELGMQIVTSMMGKSII